MILVCSVCFATDCKLYPMAAYRTLHQTYKMLLGLSLNDEDNLPKYFCSECARQLLTCSRFRTRCLRAHLVMMEIQEKYDCVTIESIQAVHAMQNPLTSKLLTNDTGLDLDSELLNEDVDIEKQTVKTSNNIKNNDIKAENDDIINDTEAVNNDTLSLSEPNCNTMISTMIKAEFDDTTNVLDSPRFPKHNNSQIKNENTIHQDIIIDSEIANDTASNEISVNHKELNDNILDLLTLELMERNPADVENRRNYNDSDNKKVHMDAIDDEEIVNNDPLSLHSLQKDKDNNDKDNDMNNHCYELNLNNMKHEDAFVGEDCPSDVSDAVVDVEQIVDNGTGVEHISKRAHGLLGNLLSCDISPYQSDSEFELLDHLKGNAETVYECKKCSYKTNIEINLTQHASVHCGEKPFSCDLMYTCDICKRSFRKKEILRSHILGHLSSKEMFTCDVCNKVFKRKGYLSAHMQTHSTLDPKSYSCSFCERKFKTMKWFQAHVASHSQDKLTCDYCGRKFSQKPPLIVHLRTHTGEKPYSCSRCEKSFYTEDGLNKHFEAHTRVKHKCDKCIKQYNKKELLEKHIMLRHEKKLQCDVCNKMYNKKSALECHLRRHYGIKEFKCNYCEKAFVSKEGLKYHLETHLSEKTYPCEVCGKLFASISSVMRHLLTHQDGKPFSCDICQKTFKSKVSLKLHMKTHTKSNDYIYSCGICNKKYRSKQTLYGHSKTHSNVQTYPCNICDKVYKSKSGLEEHLERHTGKNIHTCVVCGATYSSRASLRRHFHVHKVDFVIAPGEKVHVCDVCQRAFREESALDDHRRTHAPARPMPFVCDICKRAFAAKFHLYKHMSVHSDVKRHSCTTCGKAFRFRYALVSHMGLHSSDKPYSCEICKREFRQKEYIRSHFMRVHHLAYVPKEK